MHESEDQNAESDLDPEGPDGADVEDEESTVEVKCPHCGKWVAEDADWCPHCRNNISQEEMSARPRPVFTVALVIVLVVMMAGVLGLILRGC